MYTLHHKKKNKNKKLDARQASNCYWTRKIAISIFFVPSALLLPINLNF